MDYPLCDRTVTVYRKEAGAVTRTVVEGCFYSYSLSRTDSESGCRRDTACLLVIPGDGFMPRLGDRVYDGIGPDTVDWDSFLPATVAGLGQIEYVTPRYFGGSLCHTEAGSR